MPTFTQTANGTKTFFACAPHRAGQKKVRVDGTVLPPCLDGSVYMLSENGVTFASPPDAGAIVDVSYWAFEDETDITVSATNF